MLCMVCVYFYVIGISYVTLYSLLCSYYHVSDVIFVIYFCVDAVVYSHPALSHDCRVA